MVFFMESAAAETGIGSSAFCFFDCSADQHHLLKKSGHCKTWRILFPELFFACITDFSVFFSMILIVFIGREQRERPDPGVEISELKRAWKVFREADIGCPLGRLCLIEGKGQLTAYPAFT